MAGHEYAHTLLPSVCRCSLNIYLTAGFLTYTKYKQMLNQNEPRCLFSKLENTYVMTKIPYKGLITFNQEFYHHNPVDSQIHEKPC